MHKLEDFLLLVSTGTRKCGLSTVQQIPICMLLPGLWTDKTKRQQAYSIKNDKLGKLWRNIWNHKKTEWLMFCVWKRRRGRKGERERIVTNKITLNSLLARLLHNSRSRRKLTSSLCPPQEQSLPYSLNIHARPIKLDTEGESLCQTKI